MENEALQPIHETPFISAEEYENHHIEKPLALALTVRQFIARD